MEEDIEKYKKDCDLLELTNNELIEEAKATLIDAMNRKSDGFRRPEKVALVAIENLIAKNKELEKLSENIEMFRDNNLSSEIDYVIALKSNFMEYLKTDYISKTKARKMLEKLDKEEKQELKGAKGQDRYFIKQIYQAKRSTIQELLQGN